MVCVGCQVLELVLVSVLSFLGLAGVGWASLRCWGVGIFQCQICSCDFLPIWICLPLGSWCFIAFHEFLRSLCLSWLLLHHQWTTVSIHLNWGLGSLLGLSCIWGSRFLSMNLIDPICFPPQRLSFCNCWMLGSYGNFLGIFPSILCIPGVSLFFSCCVLGSWCLHWGIVRATLLNIPKWVLCGLYKNSGLSEMRLMGWLWSDMIRNGKGSVGWDRCVSPNMVEYPKRTQLGCPLSSY